MRLFFFFFRSNQSSAKPGSCCKVFLKKQGYGFGFIFKGSMQQKTASHIKPLLSAEELLKVAVE